MCIGVYRRVYVYSWHSSSGDILLASGEVVQTPVCSDGPLVQPQVDQIPPLGVMDNLYADGLCLEQPQAHGPRNMGYMVRSLVPLSKRNTLYFC